MGENSNQKVQTLYDLCLSSLINYMSCCKTLKSEYRDLPENVLFDLYYQMYIEKRLCLLGGEYSNLDIFSRMLRVKNKRVKLLESFQGLTEHSRRVTTDLVLTFESRSAITEANSRDYESIIDTGLRLGGFLSEAGWYWESGQVLTGVQQLCSKGSKSTHIQQKLLECCHKLIHVQAVFCDFPAAAKTHELALETVKEMKKEGLCPNLAGLYAEFSVLFFIRSEYDEAYRWSIEALKHINANLPAKIIVDILRQAAKSCVVKREFKKAGLLIRQAVSYAREIFSESHPVFSDVLMDYGFYLLNFDSILHSVKIYEMALEITKNIFGKSNLRVAVGHEDLAYALYVHEYSSGRFYKAREHAERAIKIMETLVPKEHLMLASAKRVKALILEEIALDLSVPGNASIRSQQQELLTESEALHMAALKLSLKAFGEKNVQTAKHYGNLGRLYQSMRKYQEAEKMHLRAIAIKEELLGIEDYEVGLSIGHLASLYNYHMEQYREAEKLYHRSIAISLKLFGNSYSGLEYDYRGLVHVYSELKEVDRMVEYTHILTNWMELRDQHIRKEVSPIDFYQQSKPMQELTRSFFTMDQ